MTDIEKKAYEAFPDDGCVNSGLFNQQQAERREGYIKCAEEYESLQKIRGWVARNKEICGGRLSFFTKKPQRGTWSWLEPDTMEGLPYEDLPKKMFPEISWKSEPVEVELLIRKV